MQVIVQYYRRMSLREKVLMTAFLWVLVFIGFVLVLDGVGKTWHEWQTWSRNLKDQRSWLALAPTVEGQLQESLQKFNPERTFNSAALVGRIDALARQTGVNHDISTPRSQQGEKFEFHTMRVSIRNTPMDKWLAFADKLEAESPYINLESVRLSADNRNPELLDGQLILKSFELKEGG